MNKTNKPTPKPTPKPIKTNKIIDLESHWQMPLNGKPSPYLLVVLHGRGDSLEGFKDFQEELNIPNLNFLLLDAPAPYEGGYSWYGHPPNQLAGIKHSSLLLKNTFDSIQKRGFILENCFLLGFSQGCLLTLEFGGRLPYTLAGYIGISGYCYDTQALLAEKTPEAIKGRWLITHGKRDQALPIAKTRPQIHELIKYGFPMEFKEYNKGHTIDPVLEIPYIKKFIKKGMEHQP